MKIVSWNCSGKFREKFSQIQTFNADIYIIQECENPKTTNSRPYSDFAINYLWIGSNKNKGLGVFCKKEILLEKNNWNPYCLRHFLPVKINRKFNLLAIWASAPYIEEYYIYQSIHKNKFDINTIIMGDFNSNACWDKKHNTRNHTNTVNELKTIGLISAYHEIFHKEHGKETEATFYLYKDPQKPYHIDYAFLNKKNLRSFFIPQETTWLKYSDHKPLILTIT